MIPIGTLANGGAIIAGSLIGILFHNRFPERVRTIVFQGLGLCVLVLGLQMALKSEDLLLVIFSILIGGIIGELLNLESLFEKLAGLFKLAVRSKNPGFTEGFVTASLIYCIGAMAIVGSLDEGIRGNPDILLAKALLDGFASVALAASFGVGVLFSFIPVVLYQGSLTLFANAFQHLFTPDLIAQLTATGGILIMAIGINLLELARIKIGNLLPALVAAVLLTLAFG